MKKNELTTAANLEVGDRFYFANDKNKMVWQMVEGGTKTTNYQTYTQWCVPARVFDGMGSEIFKKAYIKPLRSATQVVYLRSTKIEVAR